MFVKYAGRPRLKRSPVRFTISVFAIIIAFGGIAANAVEVPSARTNPSIATSLNLEQYKGKVVYLDFWASWCAPCKQSFPYMQLLSNSFGRRGFVVVAVNVDHDPRLGEAFVRQSGTNFSVFFDPKGNIATKYHVEDMPTSMLIGRDGRVRFIHKGFFPGRQGEYQSHIEELINERG